MYKCELCNREFENPTKLVSHLTHPKSFCKTDIKEYYDKFLRKPDEGICIYCGRETSFGSIVKGYPTKKCKHCRNRGSKTKEKRSKNYEKKREQKKIDDGYYNLPEQCELCKQKNIEKRFKTRQGLAKHISQKHTKSVKEYYDKFLRKPDEGICPITGKSTNFKNMVEGYFKYSGRGNDSSDPEVQKKKEETLLKNFGVTNAGSANSEQRIKNFKLNFEKQRKLKQQRLNLLSVLRQLTIDRSDKNQCQICGLKFDNILSLSIHIRCHDISAKDYYDKFFRKDGEGICPVSGLETTFNSLTDGYLRFKEGYHSNEEVVQKIKNTWSRKIRIKVLNECHLYNIKILDSNEIDNITSLIHLQCTLCNHVYMNRIYNIQLGYGKCPKCFPRNNHISKIENEVYDFIKTLVPKENIIQSYKGLIKNKNTGYPLELDLYIPSLKLAIEFNGLYWHSEEVLSDPYNYHLNKFNLCKEEGVRLIQIFEDEWLFKREIIESIIKFKLKINNKRIYARQCVIKEIEPSLKDSFLEENHIQGKDKSKIKLGLFYNDSLVGVMTFSHGNISKGGNPNNKLSWELNRYATKKGYHVIGGAGKLLKYFQRNYEWKSIYSYADLRYSVGNLYHKLGFNLVHQTTPEYWYVDQVKRIHRFNLRKRPDEPKDIPEWQLRLEEGYYRIWDCGHLKFELNNI